MKKVIAILSTIVFVTLSCTKDTLNTSIELDDKLKKRITSSTKNTLSYYILPDENDLTSIPQDPKNPLTQEKVKLGKMMFFDTGLAEDAMKPEGIGTYSCSSCHIPEAGFYPNNYQGVADGGSGFGNNGDLRLRNSKYDPSELDVQSARPLSLVNVAYVKNTFWNGQFGAHGVNEGTEDIWDAIPDTEHNHLGFEGIETQNMEGLKTHRIKITKEILERNNYLEMYDEVFENVPEEERYTIETASLAFSAYIRTILANQAPFQKWLKNDHKAMTDEAKKGAILFFGKARCSDCHYRPNLGSLEFHALGVNNMYQRNSFNTSESDRRNLGRGGFTLDPKDNHKFKVPGLYNVSDNNFFFHGSSKTSLEDVIEYKVAATKENNEVPDEAMSKTFRSLDLNEEEKGQLLEFITNGLRDPNLTRYKPESVPSGNCFPNNDFQSRKDTGCL